MHRIKITGYITIEDHEYDDGPLGPLTEAATNDIRGIELCVLDDLEFEEVEG